MRRSTFKDPYGTVVGHFNKKGVRYVVVGMTGINYYAENPSETFATLDYDIFVEPSQSNVKKGVETLEALGFTLICSEEALTAQKLPGWVRQQRTIVATTPDGLTVELLLRVSGYPFSEMAKDAATFSVQGIPVRVARLNKLLRSKKLAGRPKDLQFLRRYESLLEQDKD